MAVNPILVTFYAASPVLTYDRIQTPLLIPNFQFITKHSFVFINFKRPNVVRQNFRICKLKKMLPVYFSDFLQLEWLYIMKNGVVSRISSNFVNISWVLAIWYWHNFQKISIYYPKNVYFRKRYMCETNPIIPIRFKNFVFATFFFDIFQKQEKQGSKGRIQSSRCLQFRINIHFLVLALFLPHLIQWKKFLIFFFLWVLFNKVLICKDSN